MSKQSADTIFAILTLVCWVFLAVVLVVALWALVSARGEAMLSDLRDMFDGQTLPLAWVISLVALVGSLTYSEVFHLVPCRYCWFQRIGIYPLAIILGIAVVTRDRGVRKYVLGLNIPTILVSIWHVLIERFPNLESVGTSCDPANPCSAILVEKFGIVTLPVMALTTSVTIAVLMLLTRSVPPEDEYEDAALDSDFDAEGNEVGVEAVEASTSA